MYQTQTMSVRVHNYVVLFVIGLLLLPAGLTALTPGVERASAQATEEFAITQGARCTTVTPLGDGSRSVESYYDYDVYPDYSSHGTGSEQASATSNLYLYRGSGGVSLVMLHDRRGDGSGGGTVTFDVGGLPADADWAVEDDTYPNRDDEFVHAGTESHIEWVWAPGRTDGAAVRGVGDGYEAITVRPGFNEASDRWETWNYTGEDDRIATWRVLSGDGSTVRTLALGRPVTVSPGPCDVDLSPVPTTTTTVTSTPTSTATSTAATTTAPSTTTTATPVQTTTTTTATQTTTTTTTTRTTTTQTSTATTATQTPTATTATTATATAASTERSDDGSDRGRRDGRSGGGSVGSGVGQDGGLGIRSVDFDEANVTTGAPVEFAVVLSNTDVVPHSREVALRVDGETVAAKRVTVDSGEERTIVLTHAFDSAGERTFRIGAHRTTVSVGSAAMATTGTPTATASSTATASPAQESETATRSTDGATTGTTAVPTGVERGGELSSVRRVSGLSTTQLAGVGIAALLGGIVVVTLVLDRD
jgi:hypothetical protein